MTLNYSAKSNQPPSQSGWLKLGLDSGEIHTFTLANFTTETGPPYVDPEGDPLEAIKVTSLPTLGEVRLSSVAISIDDEITSAQLTAGDLTYHADASQTAGYADGDMEFLVSDTGSSTFTTDPQRVIFIVADNINEGPNTIGDGSASVELGGTFTFTRASLTSQLNPPYEDPEGDAAANLLIVAVPEVGELRLNNNLVYDGDIISFGDIDSGLLIYHSDPEGDIGFLEGFEFQISDLGSGEYRG